MYREPIDLIPLWLFVPLITAFDMLAVECGYRFGRWRRVRGAVEKEAPVAAMVASILGLLAFLLAFTFSLAASRFDARRHAMQEEANAIGTTYLRARLLPEPRRSEIKDLLREYTELRARGMTPARIDGVISRSEELQQRLWEIAATVADTTTTPLMTGLFLQSLNQMIDLHSTRIFAGLRSRIPASIWLVLFALAAVGMGSVGYQAGLTGTRRSPEMPTLALAFAIVFYLIVDLDRAYEGLLRVGQDPMADLLRTMSAARR